MKTDIDIAQAAKLEKISIIAKKMNDVSTGKSGFLSYFGPGVEKCKLFFTKIMNDFFDQTIMIFE